MRLARLRIPSGNSAIQKNNLALGFFLMLPLLVGYALLSNFGSPTNGTFQSLLVFFLMGGFALIASLAAYQAGITPLKWFDGEFSKQDVFLIAAAYAGLLVAMQFLTAYLPGATGIIIALTAGGLLLGYVFFTSQNILVPLIGHALYNISVLTFFGSIATGGVIASVPTFPSVTTVNANPLQSFFNMAIIQIAGTAFSEETLKVSVALGLFILLRADIRIAYAISVVAWAVLHSVLAYPVVVSLTPICSAFGFSC